MLNNKSIKLPELLAPAGGMEQLIAAVENGADAVYLGGKLFNARNNADNFHDEEIKKAISFAHIRGVNVYITLNTLISDSEMEEAMNYAAKLYEAGADAVIVQDIGFASLIKKELPDFNMHFSTQASIYNLDGVEEAKAMGGKRVVLARELSLDEIEQIAKNTDLEIEVFVHGALCMAYSGQCFLSGMIGGRSGNRGQCAQPCRLPYSLLKEKSKTSKSLEKKYYLSPKDLCSLEYLDRIIAAGVSSLKIEGRMKSPEYVAIVTAGYRKYLDSIGRRLNSEYKDEQYKVDEEDLNNLKQIYNRGNFTTAYLLNKPGKDLITEGRSKHWGTYLGKVAGRNEKKKYVDILLEGPLSIGDGIEILNEKLSGNIVTWMQKEGEKIVEAKAGDRATIGYISGTINIGEAVYKISDKELNRQARESFEGKPKRKVPLKGAFTAQIGQPLRLILKDDDSKQVEILSAYEPEAAVKKALSGDMAMAQIKKTGGVPFFIEDIELNIGENLAVPLSEINSIRRKAIDDLTAIRADKYPGRIGMAGFSIENTVSPAGKTKSPKIYDSPKISAYFYKWPNMECLSSLDVDRVYLPLLAEYDDNHKKAVGLLKNRDIPLYVSIPPITKGRWDEILKSMVEDLELMGVSGFLIGNLGHLHLRSYTSLPLLGDYSMNIYNSYSVEKAKNLGLKGLTLSFELTKDQTAAIKNKGMDLETIVYGRVAVMVSEHCVLGAEPASGSKKCSICMGDNYFLKDRMEALFPIITDPISCRTTILNKDNFYRRDYIKDLFSKGINSFRLNFYNESTMEIQKIIDDFRRV